MGGAGPTSGEALRMSVGEFQRRLDERLEQIDTDAIRKAIMDDTTETAGSPYVSGGGSDQKKARLSDHRRAELSGRRAGHARVLRVLALELRRSTVNVDDGITEGITACELSRSLAHAEEIMTTMRLGLDSLHEIDRELGTEPNSAII